MKSRIPIFIMTGFLGSGKTVLLNSLLRQEGFANTAVVVNEFGEIGLDHLLVSSGNDNVVLLDAGCLCCEMLGSLKETLADLQHRCANGEIPPFSRIVIETSGLADPAPVLRSIMRDSLIAHFYRLAGVICVIDAVHAEQQLLDHAEVAAQVGFADRLVITKTDRLGGKVPTDLLRDLERLNPAAELLIASNGEIAAEALLSRATEEAGTLPWLGELHGLDGKIATGNDQDHFDRPGHAHKHHHPEHDLQINSVSFWIDRPATWSGLSAWTEVVKQLYGRDLLRCKGIINMVGKSGPVVMHGVQTIFDTRRLPSWPDENTRSRLIMIGRGLREAELKQSLDWLFVLEGTEPPLGGLDALASPIELHGAQNGF